MATTSGSTLSDSDSLVLMVVGCLAGPLLLAGLWRTAKMKMVTFGLRTGFLTSHFVIAVPGTQRGLDIPHLLILTGALGFIGLLAVLLIKALRPRRG